MPRGRLLKGVLGSVVILSLLLPSYGMPSGGTGIVFVPTAAHDVSCEACLLVGPGGKVLFERAAGEPLPNASTTKIVTALVVRALLGPDTEVVVSEHAASAGGGGLDLQPGDTFRTRDLLYAALMTSSNDSAVALAEAASGSEAAFVSEMNALAEELGATGSNFVTPHGLDRPGHVSTVSDLALFAAALLDDPLLARIVATETHLIPGPSGSIRLENRNLLLGSYPGAIGVKTGSTREAGEALVAAAERGGARLIAVVLRSTDAAADATALLDRGFRMLARSPLARAGECLGTLHFPSGGATGVVAGRTATGLAGPSAVVALFVLRPGLTGPIEAGTVVGRFVFKAGGERISVVKALSADTVDAARTTSGGRLLAGLVRSAAALLGRD